MKLSDKIHFKLSHTEKALLISAFIEVLIIVMLFNIGFKQKVKEKQYAIEFDDKFNFDDLKPEEKIELPDISKYTHKKYRTNVASNALQEEEYFEKYKESHENALKNFYKQRENNQSVSVGEEKTKKKQKENKKRFTGNSNIRYFVKNRRDIFLSNPLYTCPEEMSGLIVIDVRIDRSGNVVSAKYNKAKSTGTAACLIESTLQAARESYFNEDMSAPEIQEGFITYQY